MNPIIEKIRTKLSAKYPLERVNLAIEVISKVGGEGTVLFEPGGTGAPFELELHSPTMKADDKAIKEMKRLRDLQALTAETKERAFYSAKIAEILGAVITVKVKLQKEEYQAAVKEIEKIIEEAKIIGSSNT